ncbi:DUF2391 family protein [Sphingomicrobium nitratireducens]|uniref:DUF2391 family protein n=1 Tax=Sphingomicrobium nitratireducens TaxID=2964666 RepID=UPI00223EA0AF
MIETTPWHEEVRDGDVECAAGEVEIRDLARGFAGALFVSLPLLFTMEMWEIARTIPDALLIGFLGISFLINAPAGATSVDYRVLAYEAP